MNLYSMMQKRKEEGNPIRVGVIGAGKFASMFFTQVLNTPGIHLVGVADLDTKKARAALKRTGWPVESYTAKTFAEALRTASTLVTDDAVSLIREESIEVIVEVTGNPIVGVVHALECIDHGKDIIMVNVEADCLVGPILQKKAAAAGVVYSMAYGDQPALIAELVDWCRTVGYQVVAAGKGTKYLPEYSDSTPDTVWDYYGFTEAQIASGDFNPVMFNSFLDGTKSAIEMAAVANATGLTPQPEGLAFPPVSVQELPSVLRPKTEGGILSHSGTVEVVSSLTRCGQKIEQDLRWGVYVTFRARTDYAADCFAEYGVVTDDSGRYASLYRPYHMIGMELGVSVVSAVMRREPTGAPRAFVGDAVATAKRDLRAGETLDGEGGYTVYGKLASARTSLDLKAVPIGLAHGAKLTRPIAKGGMVTWADVKSPSPSAAMTLRAEMQESFQ